MIKSLSFLVVFVCISCTPFEEQVIQIGHEIQAYKSHMASLEVEQEHHGEDSFLALKGAVSSVQKINRTLARGAKILRRNPDKLSDEARFSLDNLQASLKEIIEQSVNVRVAMVPSWHLSEAQRLANSLDASFGELASRYTGIYTKSRLQLGDKRVVVSVDAELLDTKPMCMQKFQTLGLINTGVNIIVDMLNDDEQSTRSSQNDINSCIWRAFMTCDHQMDLQCLDRELQNQALLNLVTGRSCDYYYNMFFNVINTCRSQTPVLR